MAQYLAQVLVLHRHVRLAPHAVAELGLNHVDRRFDVGPLVVVRPELVAVEVEEVIRLGEQPAGAAGVAALERD